MIEYRVHYRVTPDWNRSMLKGKEGTYTSNFGWGDRVDTSSLLVHPLPLLTRCFKLLRQLFYALNKGIHPVMVKWLPEASVCVWPLTTREPVPIIGLCCDSNYNNNNYYYYISEHPPLSLNTFSSFSLQMHLPPQCFGKHCSSFPVMSCASDRRGFCLVCRSWFALSAQQIFSQTCRRRLQQLLSSSIVGGPDIAWDQRGGSGPLHSFVLFVPSFLSFFCFVD